MGLWKKLFGQETEAVDYYEEGMELLNAGKYQEALTSFRLALRASPSDTTILQQIAISYTRCGMNDEAIRTYKKVLSNDANSPGAHYGLAFLLLHEGRKDSAMEHLRAFLTQPPDGPEAERHIDHARRTLADLESAGDIADGAIP
jgi:Flp pilus assembly protein TadD